MIKRQLFTFILRWIASSFGMYFCITRLGMISPESQETFSEPWLLFVAAGLIFSLVNSFVKPIVKICALPLAILTMGISTFVINTLMVLLTIELLPGVSMEFWSAALSSVIMSFINGVLNVVIG